MAGFCVFFLNFWASCCCFLFYPDILEILKIMKISVCVCVCCVCPFGVCERERESECDRGHIRSENNRCRPVCVLL